MSSNELLTGPKSPDAAGARFISPAFVADARADLDRLAGATDSRVVAHRGGHAVQLTDPSGIPVRVVHGIPEFALTVTTLP